MVRFGPKGYWREALAFGAAATAGMLGFLVILAFYAAGVVLILERTRFFDAASDDIGVLDHLIDVVGTTLGVLVALRLNAAFARWWEARQLWGAVVNQTRSLAVASLAYGPAEPGWRERIVRRAIAFAHATCAHLRNAPDVPELAHLLGPDEARAVSSASHRPLALARRIAGMLGVARERLGLDPYAFLQIDAERARLLDSLGGLERIRNTPLVRTYVITVRQFILVALALTPLTLYSIVTTKWLVPLITVFIGYPIMILDEIGAELEDPFHPERLGHLPLENYTATIEANLLALLDDEETLASSGV